MGSENGSCCGGGRLRPTFFFFLFTSNSFSLSLLGVIIFVCRLYCRPRAVIRQSIQNRSRIIGRHWASYIRTPPCSVKVLNIGVVNRSTGGTLAQRVLFKELKARPKKFSRLPTARTSGPTFLIITCPQTNRWLVLRLVVSSTPESVVEFSWLFMAPS